MTRHEHVCAQARHLPPVKASPPRQAGMRGSARGFTLIESVVVMLLVAVLATFAVSGVQAQVRKARRADAMQALMLVQLAQEQWRADHTTYADTLGAGGLNLRDHSDAGHYRLRLSTGADGAAAWRYTVTAQAIGPQAADRDCAHIALVVDGARTVVRSGPDAARPPEADGSHCWPR
jgi:type IV pilus assembly protein PilE